MIAIIHKNLRDTDEKMKGLRAKLRLQLKRIHYRKEEEK
jgi:hypothetical protein